MKPKSLQVKVDTNLNLVNKVSKDALINLAVKQITDQNNKKLNIEDSSEITADSRILICIDTIISVVKKKGMMNEKEINFATLESELIQFIREIYYENKDILKTHSIDYNEFNDCKYYFELNHILLRNNCHLDLENCREVVYGERYYKTNGFNIKSIFEVLFPKNYSAPYERKF